MEELTEDRLGGEVLDVGCGGGWLLEALAQRDGGPTRLCGVDALKARVEAASNRVPTADVRLGDARSLPFADGSFQVVTLITVLSSLADRAAVLRALREARRVTAGDGLLLCYEPHLPNPLNRHTRLITRREVEAGLGAEAAARRRITGFPPVARRLRSATTLLYPTLSRVAPTHRLTAHAGGSAPRGRG